MKSYEELISDYVSKNKPALSAKAPSKKRLIKFSEAVTRALFNSRKSDTGYGSIAESLAEAGLSESGYAKYLSKRAASDTVADVMEAENEKLLSEATDSYEERVLEEKLEEERQKTEAERLKKEEKEKAAAEKKEAERLEKEAAAKDKSKKTVLSFAEANNVTNPEILYNYALSLGLPENEARELADAASSNVKEKLRLSSIEKVREHIVLQRFTSDQAYAYAIQLGLDEADAKELADFAYTLNQDTESLFGKEEEDSGAATGKIPQKSEISSKPHTKN